MSKIDLIYNYRAIDTQYIIYGPEKVNSNIVVSTDGYKVNSISEVINKINAMVATLSPEITNCQSISSGIYGNMYMRILRGDLSSSSSDVPDYTQILTDINTNLTNLNNKFVYNSYKISEFVAKIQYALAGTVSMNATDIVNYGLNSKIFQIVSKLQQSVSPNLNITDVISALNTTIDSKQDTTIVNNDNTNLVQVEGVLDYRLKPQDSM